MYGRGVRDKRARETRSASASPADIKEGLAKTIGEFARDVELLEVARNEDRASIRELEIGVLKGP